MENEAYLSPTQLAAKYPTAHRDYEIRRLCARARYKLPHIQRGESGGAYGIRESVYLMFLDWEEGLITYDEMVEGSRRTTEGVR